MGGLLSQSSWKCGACAGDRQSAAEGVPGVMINDIPDSSTRVLHRFKKSGRGVKTHPNKTGSRSFPDGGERSPGAG
jgi:hypothetical protein